MTRRCLALKTEEDSKPMTESGNKDKQTESQRNRGMGKLIENRIELYGMGWDGMGWDGMGWDGMG